MKTQRVQYGWIIIGLLMLCIIFILSIDPHLVTNQSPLHRQLADYQTGQSAPFAPSKAHPFGTDPLGRDLLALTLAGTFSTILPAILITFITILLSILCTALATLFTSGMVRKTIETIGGAWTSVPILLILILAMNQRNLHSPYQSVQYLAWLVALGLGRGIYAFYQSSQSWFAMDFVEAAVTVGRSHIAIFFTHLRPWLLRFTIEYVFSEFARVLSLMTMLAAFHIYSVEYLSSIPFFISFPPIVGIQSAITTWISLIGDATNNGAFISYPYFLYAPAVALVTVVMGANLIARGIRGQS